jgi:hypothetical protein
MVGVSDDGFLSDAVGHLPGTRRGDEELDLNILQLRSGDREVDVVSDLVWWCWRHRKLSVDQVLD